MGNELFEVAFSGQISESANLQEVKARVGKMFKADGQKLEQLFSGQRIVIKKNVDQETAEKYKHALHSVGAVCVIESVPTTVTESTAIAAAQAAEQLAERSPPATSSANESSAETTSPPQTDPLGISADQIGDLEATIAPPGSELQNEIKQIPEPQYDLSAFDLAPLGSTLGDTKKSADPPPPDTSGLTMVEE